MALIRSSPGSWFPRGDGALKAKVWKFLEASVPVTTTVFFP
jgi:hypothetical protein